MAGSEAPALRKPPATATPHPPTVTAPVADSTPLLLKGRRQVRQRRGRRLAGRCGGDKCPGSHILGGDGRLMISTPRVILPQARSLTGESEIGEVTAGELP